MSVLLFSVFRLLMDGRLTPAADAPAKADHVSDKAAKSLSPDLFLSVSGNTGALVCARGGFVSLRVIAVSVTRQGDLSQARNMKLEMNIKRRGFRL